MKATAANRLQTVEVDDWAYWRRQGPPPAEEEAAPKEQRRRDRLTPRRGYLREDGGRAAGDVQPTVWRATSSSLAGIFPWLTPRPLPAIGVPIGQDVHTRNAFSCHLADWVRLNITTNPNAIVTGIPGSGKSALLKAMILRFAALGVRSFVLGDIKGEYDPLARFLGVEPPVLGPGSNDRLNPLDSGPLGTDLPSDPEDRQWRLDAVHGRRLKLLTTLVDFRLGRRTGPLEEEALGLALRRAEGFESTTGSTIRDPLIADVLNELWRLGDDEARELHVVGGADELRRQIHEAGTALQNLLTGSLAGLFDGPSTYRVDFSAPIQTVDIHLLEGIGEEPIALALACLSSWGQAAIDDPRRADDELRLVVRDEVWRQMRYPALVDKLDSDLRLSRATGTMQVLATHRFSDFEAAANPAVAKELVSSCATKVFLAQDVGPLEVVGETVGLSDEEKSQIAGWIGAFVGKALWRVGNRPGFVVQGNLSQLEKDLFHTNNRMVS